ncbi:MAG: DUF192 domain-containing protein [Henriciella sp.]|nr:DUF192 domain-containing protein [Henriciella sp.]
MKLFRIPAFACLVAALPIAAAADPMDVTPLSIVSAEATHEFSVEVADDAEEISFGLMERESMDADKGMLFDFNPPREPNMYMKNTLIPLDMLFIAADGHVEMIARNTVPGSLRTISPGVPVRAVLELKGGLAAELGIQPGDTVQHPLFGNVEAPAE